jgi:lipoprotein-anchoring transpeptidase ErfK/SrfK
MRFDKNALRGAALLVIAVATCVACRKEKALRKANADGASAEDGREPSGSAAAPRIAANAMAALVYERPDRTSPRLGYLRLGAIVERDPKPAGTERCPKGWYHLKPQGYVCVGKGVTLDLQDPVVRASSTRPDPTKPLPYQYAFVRAVAPEYLRVPNVEEQYKTEFKLREHLGYWGRHGAEVHKVVLGANDVPLDERGVPRAEGAGSRDASRQPDGGAESQGKRSTDLSVGELLGGRSDADPMPFWLEGGRKIPNMAPFQLPASKLFAERVKRHTGLALIASFQTGSESLSRRFAVTVDLRLVPGDKLKPHTASTFHGVELADSLSLPMAFVRQHCDSNKALPCAHLYRFEKGGGGPMSTGGDQVHKLEATLPFRTVVPLSGNKRVVEQSRYYETKDGRWLRGSDINMAALPEQWPIGAKAGKKWIEVSIANETLVLWEGQKPVYATLVSAGQDWLKDPKTTKSTVLGTFRIFSKHVTATMDSNERLQEPRANTEGDGDQAPDGSSEPSPPAPGDKESSLAPSGDKGQEKSAESPFELRDVPYVQYFESGYALHAAYWHDAFGTARSHGCVNLSPVDAHRIFVWTESPVPEGWHGIAIPPGQGTMVVVHK